MTGNPAAVNEKSSNGYLLIATSGGLNQQRTGVSDVFFGNIFVSECRVENLMHK